jgi:hypothetical protein
MEPRHEMKQKILNAVYDKFGTPRGEIISEKVHFYDGWNAGGIQRGRISIFSNKYDDKLGYTRTTITSYFMRATNTKVNVYNTSKDDNKPDLVIKVKDAT